MASQITLSVGDRAADYSTPRAPGPLKAAGYRAVGRYICGSTTNPKVITPAELKSLTDAGLGLVLLFEKSALRWQGGAVAGAVDGAQAKADAARLGYPTTEVIVPAIDADVTKATLSVAVAYWKAFRDTCGHPTGVYADYDVIEVVSDPLRSDGPVSACSWQPNAGAWSGLWILGKLFRRVHPKAHMLQLAQTGGLDPSECKRPWAVWAGPTATPPPAPPMVTDPLHGHFGLYPLNPAKPTLTGPDRAQGADIDFVYYLQCVINLKAGGNIPLHGIYDEQTIRRVKDLQRYFKITEDGITGWDRQPNGTVGPNATWPIIDMLAGK